MSAPAEIVRAVESLGAVVTAPGELPFAGAVEVRWIAPGRLPEACRVVRDAGYFLESLTCVDRLDPHGVFELIYTFNRYESPSRVAFRVWAPRDEPVPTVSRVFRGADWNEREAWELFGITFAGHPRLTWLLLPEDTAWHPLLKSFTAPPPSVYDDSLAAPAATLPPAPPASQPDDEPARH